MPDTSQNLTFENQSGHSLSARLALPVEPPRAYAIFAHCFTGGKDLRPYRYINESLTRAGIAVLSFDFTGLGDSEGEFADTNFTSNVDDLIAASDFLEREYDAPAILIGHSLGGAAVLQAAGRLPSVQAVVTIGAPSEPSHVTHLLASSRDEIEDKGEAEVRLAGRTFRIQRQFLDDLEATNMEAAIRDLHKALLIFHAPMDNTVGIDNATAIYRTARHPKSFVSLDGADHLLTDPKDALYVGRVAAAWATRYVDALKPQPEPRNPREEWVVAGIGPSGYRTEIHAHGHALTADEPVDVGGTDRGPSPYEFLLASLGSCTAITLRMYADRKKWPLDGVTVRLKHDRVHAEDCADCEAESGIVDRIERVIELRGDDLSEEQRARLLEIADRCPVHRTLHGDIRVFTRFSE